MRRCQKKFVFRSLLLLAFEGYLRRQKEVRSHKILEIDVFLYNFFACCWKDLDPDPNPNPGGPKHTDQTYQGGRQARTTFEIISIYIPGLGLVAVVIAVTFKCVPPFRVTEVTYLVPSKDDL
jgi:hypothetical protein